MGGRATPIWLVALAVAIFLPNLAWVVLQVPGNYVHTAESLVAAVALLVLWFALWGRWLWLGCLTLAPFALLMPVELYYIVRYHTPTTATVIGTVLQSSPAEAQQYMGALLPMLVGACLASLTLALLAAWAAWRRRLAWRGTRRCAVAATTAVALIAVGVASDAHFLRAGSLVDRVKPIPGQLKWRSIPTYPFGVIVRVQQVVAYEHEMSSTLKRLRHFHFDAQLATPLGSGRRQIYVLVIGESSVRTHWQLFGYARATNPELSQLRNVIPIRHMVSAFSQTMTALPVMLTRKPATYPGLSVWPEPSIVTVMREAGFDTWWISNQFALGPYDSAAAQFAHEAQHVEWLNYGALNAKGKRDGDLIAPLRHALSDSTGNIFVVLHMLGSHQDYRDRYPKAFRYFRPDESSPRSSTSLWLRERNSYDNSIRYTDYVLARVIAVLKATHAVTALWYASDHGEQVPSAMCRALGHGSETQPQFRIAAFFWYSNAYADAFPQRVQTLRANGTQKTMSEDTFPSLVDMAGIDFPGHQAHETWSLFSPSWELHIRWVDQFRLVDFDKAKIAGKCRTLLPR